MRFHLLQTCGARDRLRRSSGPMYLDQHGFTLIETLVALIVLTLAVASLTAALRQVYFWADRKDRYAELYMTVNSVVDMIVSDQISDTPEAEDRGQGENGGIRWNYHCTTLESRHNFVYEENPVENGNHGPFLIALQECRLTVTGQVRAAFTFYRARYCCPGNTIQTDMP